MSRARTMVLEVIWGKAPMETFPPLAYHWSCNLDPLDLSSLEVTSRPPLYFSSNPRKAAKPDEQCQDQGWPQDQLHWIMTPCPSGDQPISGDLDPERTHLGNCCICFWDLLLGPPLKSPPWSPFGQGPRGLSLPIPRAPPCLPFPLFFPSGAINFTFLTSKLQGSFPCLCNLFPKPISSTNYFCYLCDFLNKSSLGSELFPSQTQVLRLRNPGSVWPHQSNTCCHSHCPRWNHPACQWGSEKEPSLMLTTTAHVFLP